MKLFYKSTSIQIATKVITSVMGFQLPQKLLYIFLLPESFQQILLHLNDSDTLQ